MKNIKILLFTINLTLLALTTHVQAADKDGKFAAKGAARKSCADFLTATEQRSSDFLLYAGWLEGYLTSFNQVQAKNYDISPWQTTEFLLMLLQKHCQSNPEIKYFDAANALIKSIFPIRLNEEGTIVKVQVGDAVGFHYEEILLRAKQRLKAMGFYKDEVDGKHFTNIDSKVFLAYQKKLGLKETGMPDQATLASLFLKALN